MGRLPYVGIVDGGTLELVRSFNVEIVSSADLVAHFAARLSVEQIAAHRMAARNVISVKNAAFKYVAESVASSKTITEYDVAQFVLGQFASLEMDTHDSPICGVNENAGNPHYEPEAGSSKTIERGQLLLLDLWAKLRGDNGIYADITWMAFVGSKSELPERFVELFRLNMAARDRAIEFIRARIDSQPVYGSEVDDICRNVIGDGGYGEFFTHRTGHSITTDGHGCGPNIDNLETEDRRKLQKGHLFSIEPGIYLDDCGFRTEVNMLIGYDGAEVTTLPLQTEIICLLD
jgi:Xaa-Pro aminopeptidase